MTESQFIAKNEDKWNALEELLKQDTRDADKLNELFIKVSSDLSFAKTYYPNRLVRLYLNNLTQRVFDTMIIKESKMSWNLVTDFFVHVLPQEIYRARKALMTSFLVFALALTIGIVSSKHYEGFAELILGQEYISMTEANIEKGDPMAVYKDQDKMSMFFGITTNNVRVAFLAFVLGILGSLGTILVLISNGVMVGAFQYFFYAKGLFWVSFLTIWIHGTIEISCIVIAGGAGIVLGNGLLFPNTYERSSALQVSALRALRIILGTVPLFVVAGFLESYVTRQTELPVFVKGAIIGLSALLIIFMWIIYPWYYHKTQEGKNEDYDLTPQHNENIVVNKLEKKSTSNIFADSFLQLRQQIGYTLKSISAPTILILSFCLFLALQNFGFDTSIFNEYQSPDVDLSRFALGGWKMIGLYSILIGFLLTIICANLEGKNTSLHERLVFIKSYFIKILCASLLLYLPYAFIPSNLFLLGWLIISPHFVVILIEHITNNKIRRFADVYNAYLESYKKWPSYLIYYAVLYIIAIVANLLKSSLATSVIVEFISWHKLFPDYLSNLAFTSNLTNWLIITIFLPLTYYFFRNQYYSNTTEENAVDLNERLKSFGNHSPSFES